MRFLKFFAFLSVAVLFIVHQQLAKWMLRDEEKRLRYFLRSISLTSRCGLWILNVEASYPDRLVEKGRLLVCNHLSYLDVLVLFAHYPSLFVTSVEMGEVFFLGRITRLGGCFHVERRKHIRKSSTLARELSEIQKKIESGFNVFLFPEGTSSDGQTVLPFKNTFFQTSFDLQVPVTPLTIKYDRLDVVPWYGEMTFASHLLRLCSLKMIKAEVKLLDEFHPAKFTDRFEMAHASYESIKDCYHSLSL